ncbi:MAG: amidohydrolase family protein, partial [Woeseiaceae bacterium]
TEHVLRAASSNAAAALSLNLKLGRLAAGAHADLILVDGDPLQSVADTLKVVAVVRNGRFYSVAGLLDKATAARMR